MNVFEISDIRNKIHAIDSHIETVCGGDYVAVPFQPARDIDIQDPAKRPAKKGLSTAEGQARLIHDLASIELQAMELALRTLTDYYKEIKHSGYLEPLVQLIYSERDHFNLCLNGLADLGFAWGHWPVHLALWNAVDPKDTLLERVFIVHRYLEGSGLDAGDTIVKRLSGIGNPKLSHIVKTISTEEMDHVQLGSRWFFDICKSKKIDPAEAFSATLDAVKHQLPKRLEPINIPLRTQALFTMQEIQYLESHRQYCRQQNYPIETT